ncbi:hypothetical protein [Caenimonas soli]|uniref:hypothetical protein n=1 Tax=Caenimonas soli TaxID=2735555 RepID=UPI001F468BD4|nr:hypothetical protein [Caenimonas soli]
MRPMPSKSETLLLLACACLVAVALFGPAVIQPPGYHGFADQRVLWGVPFAMDVLSNLPFALAGVAGLWFLGKAPPRALSNVQRAMAILFFGGLVLTACGSAWYHAQPDDAGLAIDRIGMAAAFAGLLGLAAAGRVSERAGALLGLTILLLAPVAIELGSSTGNVLPWAALQFGGMAVVVWLAWLRPRPGALVIRLGWVILAYAAAKLLEINDRAVFDLTGQLVSGHTLKHLVAALAALPVLAAVLALRKGGQNATGIAWRSPV